jgi:hypothetical protein
MNGPQHMKVETITVDKCTLFLSVITFFLSVIRISVPQKGYYQFLINLFSDRVCCFVAHC